jgi:hypothetical protein
MDKMATKDQIKQTILAVAGNPESGVIAQIADELANAIASLDAKPSEEDRVELTDELRLTKETRVTKASETR